MIKSALKDDGYLGIVCFNEDGASTISDREVYREQSLKGGIGYSEERFKSVFMKDFTIITYRKMKRMTDINGLFGEDFLSVSLMKKA
ncbi:methyltransferase [Geomicrobium sp. JCM 19055]|nr:methyltransferase [Geomicrobium sp. JCM 19055]